MYKTHLDSFSFSSLPWLSFYLLFTLYKRSISSSHFQSLILLFKWCVLWPSCIKEYRWYLILCVWFISLNALVQSACSFLPVILSSSQWSGFRESQLPDFFQRQICFLNARNTFNSLLWLSFQGLPGFQTNSTGKPWCSLYGHIHCRSYEGRTDTAF